MLNCRKDIEGFLPNIFTEIFSRFSQNKTLKYTKSFIVFLSLFVGKHGPSAVISRIDAIQAVSFILFLFFSFLFSFIIVLLFIDSDENMFGMVLDSLYINNVAKVNGKIERRICCVAMVKLLTESPEMVTTYISFW